MARHELTHERLTHSVIGAFYEVYNTLGFGYLEQVYLEALAAELRARGHVVEREVRVRVSYKSAEIGWQRLDMLVDALLIVEVKSTTKLDPSARRQLLNYLCATRLPVGCCSILGRQPASTASSANPSGLEPEGLLLSPHRRSARGQP